MIAKLNDLDAIRYRFLMTAQGRLLAAPTITQKRTLVA
jgi:hypothetical protein